MTEEQKPSAPDGADGDGHGVSQGGDDEDFARIPPPSRRRSPITALAVCAVGGLLLFHLVDDTRYALAPAAPVELGGASGLWQHDVRLGDNSFVTVSGLPDRRNALLFEPKGDKYRRAFFRLLGTDTRLLVGADETSTRTQLEDRWTGRLRRFDRIPWAEQVRDYYAKEVRATRFLDLDLLKKRLAGGGELRDRAGDPLTLGADHAVGLEVDFPEDLRVSLPRKQFAVEEDARHELQKMGLPPSPALTEKDWFIYVLRVPRAKRDAVLKQLEERDFPFASRRERYASTMGELSVGDGPDAIGLVTRKEHPGELVESGNDLTIQPAGARTSIPWARVASVQVAAPITIPGDAFILVEKERPSDFTWVLALDALLVLFIAFNLFALARSLRRPATT